MEIPVILVLLIIHSRFVGALMVAIGGWPTCDDDDD